MPVSQFLKWKAYQRLRGPLSEQLRSDFHAAMVAMHAGGPYPDGTDVDVLMFLPPWTNRQDFAAWMFVPEDEGPPEFEIE